MMLFGRSTAASATEASAIDCLSKESGSFASVASKICSACLARLSCSEIRAKARDHAERFEITSAASESDSWRAIAASLSLWIRPRNARAKWAIEAIWHTTISERWSVM